MRNIILAAICALAVTGCGTNQAGQTTITLPTITIPSISPSVDAAIAKAKEYAVTACGYEPVAETILSVVARIAGIVGVPGASVVNDLGAAAAQAICGAVSRLGARRGGSRPQVYGVAIQGRFVR